MEALVLSAKQRWLKKKVGAEWEDIMQDARLRCLPHELKDYYMGYFSRTITNIAINFLRHQTSVELISISDREEKPIEMQGLSYETNFEANYDVRKFMMDHWSAPERDVILMFFIGQLSVRGASEMLGRSRMDTHRWLNCAKEQLRKGLV